MEENKNAETENYFFLVGSDKYFICIANNQPSQVLKVTLTRSISDFPFLFEIGQNFAQQIPEKTLSGMCD